MDDTELIEILWIFEHKKPEGLQEAQNYMNMTENSQYNSLVLKLSEIVGESALCPELRNQAGLQMHNIIWSQEEEEKAAKRKKWFSLSAETINEVKMNCLSALSNQQQGYHAASQCVAYIACYQISVDPWLAVARWIHQNISKDGSLETFKRGCLEVLGYILEELNPDLIADQSEDVLVAIVCGLKEEETSLYVKRAAAKALFHSLDFMGFFSENERDKVMELVYQTIQRNTDIELAATSLKCLVRIVRQDYDDLELALDKRQNFTGGSVVTLVTVLLGILARGKAGDGFLNEPEDEWNPTKAAVECLSLLAEIYEERIVDLVGPYVLANIGNNNYRLRYAALRAFSSILEGAPRLTIQTLVDQVMDAIMALLSHWSFLVQDAAALALVRICRLFPKIPLKVEYLNHLLKVVEGALKWKTNAATLKSKTRVATNVCSVLCSLAKGAHEVASNGNNDPETYELSPFFDKLVDQLFDTANRSDCGGTSVEGAAYSTLMNLLKYAPRDCYGCIQRTTILLLDKIQSFLEVQRDSLDMLYEDQLADIEIHLCSTLQTIISRSTQEDVLKITDKVMAVLIPMFERAQSFSLNTCYTWVQEEAILVVSALIDSIGTHFSKYLPGFMDTFIYPCRIDVTEYQIWINTIGVIRDLTRIMPLHMKHYLSRLFKYMDPILTHVGVQTVTCDELLGSCCGLVKDIITAFGKDSLVFINTDAIKALLNNHSPTNENACLAFKELMWLTEGPADL